MTLNEYSGMKLAQRKVVGNYYNFIYMGNTCLGSPEYACEETPLKIFRKMLIHACGYNPLFMLHGGDVAYDGSMTGQQEKFVEVVKANSKGRSGNFIPFFAMAGNNDFDGWSQQKDDMKAQGSLENHIKVIGNANFRIEAPGINVVSLISSESVNSQGEYYHSIHGIDGENLQWASDNMEEDSMNIMAMHVPPAIGEWSNWHMDKNAFTNGLNDLEDLMERNKVKAGFFSHAPVVSRTKSNMTELYLSGRAGAPYPNMKRTGDKLYYEAHYYLVTVINGKKLAVSNVPLRITVDDVKKS